MFYVLYCKNVRFSDLCLVVVYACASYIEKSDENTDVSAEQFEEASEADENSDEVDEFDFSSDDGEGDGGLEFPQASYGEF